MIYSRDVKFDKNEKTEAIIDSGSTANGGDHSDKLVIDFGSDNQEVSNQEITETRQSPREPEPVRRSTRERRQPDYYGRQSINLTRTQEPTSFKEAISSPDQSKWKKAMKIEMKSLKDNNVWELVELPSGRKTVGSKLVFKVKTGADGNVERYKVRLVAQGYMQMYGADYDKTFCPVARQESLRLLLALSVQHVFKLHQVDMTAAFPNGNLEEVYMAQPEGFMSKGQEHLVCRLKKSIYGLKQSLRCWNTTLDAHLKKTGFTQSNSDPRIYYKGTGGEMVCMGVYVDDIVLAAKTDEKLKLVKSGLAENFDIKDLGK